MRELEKLHDQSDLAEVLARRRGAFVVEPVAADHRDPAPPLPTGSLIAEAVPEAWRPKPVPLARLLVPLVMVVAMVAMVALMVLGAGQGGRQPSPMMLVFPIMMLASVFMMFNPQGGAEDPDEVRRTYLRHLAALREEAMDNAEAQRAHELHRHCAPDYLGAVVGTSRMWERGADDADALEVRLGLGRAALCTPIDVPDPGAAEDLDPVCAVSLRHTVSAVGTVEDLPIVLQLQSFRFVGVSGDRARELVRAMVLQLACSHGPETVGFESVGAGWQWLKWLPHTRQPAAAQFRILIVDDTPTTGVESYIDDPAITTIIDVSARRTTALGVRAEQEGICLLAEERLHVITAAGDEDLGRCDHVGERQAVALARRMTKYRRPDAAMARPARNEGQLLPLLGFVDIDELTAPGPVSLASGEAEQPGVLMWPGREQSARLRVPIGVDTRGRPVYLDLKESAQGGMGPHGLCVGATGSGKSELLRTLVTALAATHSPEELNLVLVDFKGGATFLGCDTLPHTSAVITNLENEATLVERMYDAVSGEMNRRQEILRKAGNFASVTDYTEARRSGRADLDPLPALVIVVDEFSELLGQHPDFAELFVAVGRLGRSLHVHLLLASQRLDEGKLRGLDSHLSYRIGLKTFSAGESRQVLGVADAYHLPGKPGAGYLKTDAEEITRFQASYVSGPLERRVALARPGQEVVAGEQENVSLFTGWQQVAAQRRDEAYEIRTDTSTTLLAAVVDACRATATARGHSAHQIWLPPLPRVVELPTVLNAYTAACAAESTGHQLPAVIGLIDRPYYQRQDPLVVDLDSSGGHLAIVGGPQAGKSTAVRTVVASVAATTPPGVSEGQVRVYVIDLGGGQLATLDRLPHVAAVAGRSQPQKVRRMVDEVAGLVEDHHAGIGPAPGHTFLIVDGWHHVGTSGAEFEDLSEPLTTLAADGPSAGVHLIITAPRWTTLRPAIRDLISHRIELRLGEAMDSLIDRKAQQKLPALPGRGITADAEFMLIASSTNQDLAHITMLWSDTGSVPALRMLPASLSVADLPDYAADAAWWGIGGPRLEPVAWNPQAHPHLVCVGSQGAGKSTFLSTIIRALSRLPRERARLVLIDHRRAHLGEVGDDMLAAYCATASATEQTIRDVVTTLTERLPGADITPAQLTARDWWTGPDIYVVIDDLDLVSDIALVPLVDLLPHARDIGLHVVVARKSGGIGRALYGQFLAGLRDLQPAVLLMDTEKDEGVIFGLKPGNQPVGRGVWSLRGETFGVCHVAHQPGDEEAEAEGEPEEKGEKS